MDEIEIVRCYDSRKIELKWLILKKNTKYQNERENLNGTINTFEVGNVVKVSPKHVDPGGLGNMSIFSPSEKWQFPSMEKLSST